MWRGTPCLALRVGREGRPLHHDPAGHGNPCRGEHRPGHRLVHGEGRGEHTGADVRDANQLQQALDGPVLAIRTMEGDEGDIDLPCGTAGGERGGRGHRRVGGHADLLAEIRGKRRVALRHRMRSCASSDEGKGALP